MATNVALGYIGANQSGTQIFFRGGLHLTANPPAGSGGPAFVVGSNRNAEIAITGTNSITTTRIASGAGVSIYDSKVHADGVIFQTVNIDGGAPNGSNMGIDMWDVIGGPVLIQGGTVKNVTRCISIENSPTVSVTGVTYTNCSP
jgi:hypothetical protein